MDKERLDKTTLRKSLLAAKDEIADLGGLSAFRSGEWLLALILKSFRNYSEHTTAEYLCAKYPNLSRGEIAQKLIHIASVNTALAGAVTGVAVSLDELLEFLELGIGTPWVTKCQLQLVANLAVLHEVPLDIDDPKEPRSRQP
jgi:hypothetical protein